jgi:biopolymer transport protein ExbB/TolQ
MNFIFGIIILALFILALRVIWATALQLLNALKHATQMIHRYRVKRLARRRLPVIMPRKREDLDWLAISDSVRQEIQRRNHGVNREAVRLEAQLQAKLKTIEIYEAVSKRTIYRWMKLKINAFPYPKINQVGTTCL